MGQKQSVLEKRYFRGDEKSEVHMFHRVAKFLAKNEKERQQFLEVMVNHQFLPNTPCLVNAGVPETVANLMACFVLGIEDSMEGIFNTLRDTALIHKTGGGTGFNFSSLRPMNHRVLSTNGVASGPISFMRAYDAATETVKQGGVRRGANMSCFSIHHPDVMDFITCKDDLNSFNNFNISVLLDDEFMEAVKADKDWEFSFNGEKLGIGTSARHLMDMIVEQAWKNGEPGIIFIDEVNKNHSLPDLIESTNPCVTGDTLIETRDGFKYIIDCVDKVVEIWNGYIWSKVVPRMTQENQEIWKIEFSNGCVLKCTPYHKFILSGGVRVQARELEIGRMLETWYSTTGVIHKGETVTRIISNYSYEDVYCFNESHNHSAVFNGVLTSNCGEQPLLSYEACCLGSINLSKFVFTNSRFDFKGFERVIGIAVKFLNNVIDKNEYPIEQIKEISEQNRKIGLGVMGYADMLIKMGLRYGSEAALDLTEDIAKVFQLYAHKSSKELADIDGCFPSWSTSSYAITDGKLKQPMHQRNATVTTIAPTGTISIIAECSSGIEPIYAPITINRRIDSEFVEIHPLFEEMLKERNLYDKFIQQYDKSQQAIKPGDFIFQPPKLKFFLPDIADCIVTTHEITPEEHIKTQAVWQKYTDNAVSKTINLSESATKEDVYNAYMLAYELKCKGLTVYRDGSRMSQVISTINTVIENKELERGYVLPSDDSWFGRKRKLKTGCGNLHVQTWFDPDTGELREVFASKGSEGGCNANLSGLSRVASLSARLGGNMSDIVEQLESALECASYQVRRSERKDVSPGKSCPSAIGKAIIDMYNEAQILLGFSKGVKESYIKNSKHEGCRQCGGKLKYESGCSICIQCGFSSCG